MITRYECPLSACGWYHDSPDVPVGRWPWKGSIEDTVAAVSMDRAKADERIIAAHFETHSLVEFGTELQRERARADAAESKLAACLRAIERLQAGTS